MPLVLKCHEQKHHEQISCTPNSATGPRNEESFGESYMTNTGAHAVGNADGFRVDCNADKAGQFLVETGALWVRVGQRVLRNGAQELWDSVAIEAKKEQDGTLVVRVLVFNPDWDEPLQIACIRSRPHDPECLTPLGCNLDHVAL